MRALSGIDRALDANLNRVSEGLRVLEDLVRYVLDDADLQQRLKSARHALAAAQASLGPRLIESRAALSDVGYESVGALENARESLQDSARANCKRVQEGLRVLEELSKPAASAAEFKRLRYAAYDLERDLLLRLKRPALGRGLYLVLTSPALGHERLAELAVEAGLPAVQLRDKNLDGGELLSLAKRLRAITHGTSTLFIVNDRPDIAVLSDADGLHLGQTDLAPREARKLVGAQLLVGLSTHNLAQVKASVGEPIDYIGFGPLYATNSKACPDPVIGPELLKQAAASAAHPIVAIGGLDQQRINSLDLSACHCAAVIRAVTEADDPLSAMQALNQTIQEKRS